MAAREVEIAQLTNILSALMAERPSANYLEYPLISKSLVKRTASYPQTSPQICGIRAFTEKTESRGFPAGTNRIQGLCWSGGQHGWRNRIRRICVVALLVRGKIALPSRKLRSNLE